QLEQRRVRAAHELNTGVDRGTAQQVAPHPSADNVATLVDAHTHTRTRERDRRREPGHPATDDCCRTNSRHAGSVQEKSGRGQTARARAAERGERKTKGSPRINRGPPCVSFGRGGPSMPPCARTAATASDGPCRPR